MDILRFEMKKVEMNINFSLNNSFQLSQILYGPLKGIICFFNSLYYCLAQEIHKLKLQNCKKLRKGQVQQV